MDYEERTRDLANAIGAAILAAIQGAHLPPIHVARAVIAASAGVVRSIEKAMQEEGV